MISRNILTIFFGCSLLCLLLGSFQARFVNSQSLGSSRPNNTRNNSNTTSGGVYGANLNFLLSTLTSNASRPNGFYNFTAASNDPSNGTVVYGLFLCRGDVITTDCQDCVATASREIFASCPGRNVGIIWYDNCLLRFSNQSIFSRVDFEGRTILTNGNNVSTDKALFRQVVRDTLGQILARAVINDPSGKKFAVQEQETNRSTLPRSIYALGQCTPDLSSSDCHACLVRAIANLQFDRLGARVLFPSCNIRYDTYRFYNTLPPPPSLPPLPPPPPPPPPHSLPPPPSPATSGQDNGRISTGTIVAIAVPIFIAIVLLVVIWFVCRARRSIKEHNVLVAASGTTGISFKESLQYNLIEILACTNNFAPSNRIGEGGFGHVYKGTLPNGQEIAVKRLSRNSSQGAEEFINEITLVAKLQHRNLVRLLGYCLEGEEKLLVYEFVPNKSLDYFLFDPEKQALLNWSMRYEIIGGIARGLLYLHQDSRLRIIHRDLKASNVLLDPNMNPKIADFGMARLFEFDQIEGNTNKIAGTFGYMAPEYASHGLFSVKSDVFSFGVLVLEIISGRKNSKVSQSRSEIEHLISYAWRQWRDGTPLALVDPNLGGSYVRNEVIQCIHIGLLCVQEDAGKRPTMTSVVVMLNNSVTLPTPNRPAFYGLFYSNQLTSQSEKPSNKSSRNEASITELYPR